MVRDIKDGLTICHRGHDKRILNPNKIQQKRIISKILNNEVGTETK